MAEVNNYCTVCGVVCGYLEDLENNYDESVVRERDAMTWTEQTVVVSENTNAVTLSRAYVTGQAEHDDFSSYTVRRGTDPNFDTSLRASYVDVEDSTKSLYVIEVHDWNAPNPFAVAVHSYCYHEILPRIIRLQIANTQSNRANLPREIDKDILYKIFKTVYSNDPSTSLVDYGEATRNQGETWITRRGEEWLVMEPHNIDGLLEYYQHLPKLADDIPEQSDSTRRRVFSKMSWNVFSILPKELILRLLSFLSIPDVASLKASTPVVAQVHLPPSFWRSQITNSMPWLYDLPLGQLNVDWKAVCLYMWSRSHKTSLQKLHGLVNRRRIWQMCEPIAQRYVEKVLKVDAEVESSQLDLLSSAIPGRSPSLIWPEPADLESQRVLLVNSMADVGVQNLVISIYMGEDAMVGLSVIRDGETTHLGYTEQSDSSITRIDVPIEEGDWVVGFLVFGHKNNRTELSSDQPRCLHGFTILRHSGRHVAIGRQDGDRRIFHVSEGRVVIGFHGEISARRGVSKLGLLEASCNSNLLGNSTDRNRLAAYAGTEVSLHLWKDALPLPSLHFGAIFHEGWSGHVYNDLAAREVLLFGSSDAELSRITSIAIDVRLGSFRVDYSDRKSRSIGPCGYAMQVLTVDGRSGERVVAIETSGGSEVYGVRIITSRGRQLVVGWVGVPCFRLASSRTRVLVGLCGHWNKKSTPELYMDLLTTTFLPPGEDLSYVSASESIDRWSLIEHAPPPRSWVAHEKILGDLEDNPNPGISSYIDLSLPVRQIQVCLTHRSAFDDPARLQWMSLIVTYETGSVASVGPTEFFPDGIDQEFVDSPSCTCHLQYYGNKKGRFETSHYHVESWTLQPQRLKCLQIWQHNNLLNGVRFIAADSSQSPSWGICEGGPTDSIIFGGEDRIVGLRCFIRHNARMVAYPEMIIIALQAMIDGESTPAADEGNLA